LSKLWNIAIVGATGLVGTQIVECLEESDFPVANLRLLARSKGIGEVLAFRGNSLLVEELTVDSFAGIDIAFFTSGRECSLEFCPLAVKAGAICIDISSAWRMDEQVPLVVPEVNPEAIAGFRQKGIVANPNCSTIQMLVALKPLHDYAAIKRIVVSTYQSVSGTGKKAVAELERQTRRLLQGLPVEPNVYPYQIAFNCLPQIDAFGDNGYTREEMKLINETRKILAADVRVTATAVRVPVFFGHAEAVNIETERKITAVKARELLKKAPGCQLADDVANQVYPTSIIAAGFDQVFVGRIREDESIENGLNLWVVADNIRKGAATNAVQIAGILIREYLQ
jgi:aspartate-semialdehyde dehydrogenase